MANSTGEQKNQFYELAAKLGHDSKALAKSGEQDTILEVGTIEELRSLVGSTDGETRKKNMEFMKDALAKEPKGLRAVAEAYLHGDLELTSEQLVLIQQAFPVKIRAISIVNKTLGPNEVWDLGTSAMPATIANLDKLTMDVGSRIVIRNTELTFKCQTLDRKGPTSLGTGLTPLAHSNSKEEDRAMSENVTEEAAEAADYDFGVFGATTDQIVQMELVTATYQADLNAAKVTAALTTEFHAKRLYLSTGARVNVLVPGGNWRLVDPGEGVTYSLTTKVSDPTKIEVRMLAMQGTSGLIPTAGRFGEHGACIWGNASCDRGAQGGTPGTDGGTGGQGAVGDNGLPGYRADISIGTLTGQLVFKTKGADGSVGGMGGPGGTGANGGDGGFGTACGAMSCSGGDGGKGGNGGTGGKGGKGGNGANAADIHVTVTTGKDQVGKIPLESVAGKGGAGGAAGAGGSGGVGGKAGLGGDYGKNGENGTVGTPGDRGDQGDHGGIAGRVIVNGVG